MLFFDLECLAETLCHGIGVGASAMLIVADHVLADTQLLGELGLSQTGLQASAGEQVADAVLFHLLPIFSTLNGNKFVFWLVGQDGNVVLPLYPGEQFVNVFAVNRNLKLYFPEANGYFCGTE